MQSKQKGFTLVELVTVIQILFALAMFGVGVAVAWHFISKFW